MILRIFILLIADLFLFQNVAFSSVINRKKSTSIDSIDAAYVNWYNLDSRLNKIQGVSVDKAYSKLIAGKSSTKKIVVAVIDGGIDINHEDLKGKIWINAGEIAGNNIDDDQNGFIDDINGWNFLGNPSGENLDIENYEFVRIVSRFQNSFDTVSNVDMLIGSELASYHLYQQSVKRYHEEIAYVNGQLNDLNEFRLRLDTAITALLPYTKNDQPLLAEIEAIDTKNKKEAEAKDLLIYLLKRGFNYNMLDNEEKELNKKLNTSLNLSLKGRSIVGDDCYNLEQLGYGNADVIGPSAEHGTFVAGIIAAGRNNGMGINGIAENVEIMALRAVPDGDEYDKDIALAIRYAVDNGAHIINMSFGKEFSPLKYTVDSAVAYAEKKGVLLIHASGNEAVNLDVTGNYPSKKRNDGYAFENWITVGANAIKSDKNLAGVFTNYGKQSVDLFAPGVDIVSLAPNSKYDMESGTSFSCPVTSGVAALVWSHYPQLTAPEVKNILLASVNKINKKVYLPNITSYKKTKVKFQKLSVTGGIVNAYEAFKLAENSLK